jgi:hypothetical protein
VVKAILDPYNPTGSTRFVNFATSKPVYTTSLQRCHVNHVVLDSDWEAEFLQVAEAHPHVVAYAKNQGMQFDVPYRNGIQQRRYWPDYIVRIDDGGPEPLNLIVEVKGFRGTDAQLRAETMRRLWVPGVNNLGTYGRWAFAEFIDVYEIEAAVGQLIEVFPASRNRPDRGTPMPRPPKPQAGPRPIETLVHADTRRNIPTAEFQSLAQQIEDGAPVRPARYQRSTPLVKGETRGATPIWTRKSSGAGCGSR